MPALLFAAFACTDISQYDALKLAAMSAVHDHIAGTGKNMGWKEVWFRKYKAPNWKTKSIKLPKSKGPLVEQDSTCQERRSKLGHGQRESHML